MAEQNRKKIRHYNTPGHAHELTFSCYQKRDYLSDPRSCEILLDEIEKARRIYSFRLWAYVLMPNHVHILLWPLAATYNISKILSGIKGIMSKRYGAYLTEKDASFYNPFFHESDESSIFTFWQRGGGFDRNLWNAKAILDSLNYIEANPVRKKLVTTPKEWPWSSAHARFYGKGVVPDTYTLPVAMLNAQKQRIIIA